MKLRSLLTVLALSTPLLRAAADPTKTPPADVESIALPKLTVTSQTLAVELEKWSYTQIAGFEVLANGSTRDARRVLRDFEMFTRALKVMWPANVPVKASSSLILCGAKDAFAAFLPPAKTKEANEGVLSRFLANREQAAIVIDLETSTLDIPDTALLAGNTVNDHVTYDVDHRRLLAREYTHALISQGSERPPAWIEEGLAQIIMDMEYDDFGIIYGKIDSQKGAAAESISDEPPLDATATVGDRPFNAVLLGKKLLPFDAFFAVSHDAPEARNPIGNTLWAKQAYLIVHFFMHANGGKNRDTLAQLANQFSHQPPSEAAFQQCTGYSYAEFDNQLRAYIRYTKHTYGEVIFKPSERMKLVDLTWSPATPSQIGRIKADALRLADRTDLSLASALNCYQNGAREPDFLAAYGLAEHAANHSEKAEKLLLQATQANTTLPSAYTTLAALRLNTLQAASPGQLTSKQVSSLLSLLVKAHALAPQLPETYIIIAETWAHSAVRPTSEHLKILDEGIRLFPRNDTLLLSAAQLNISIGASQHAADIAKLGLRMSRQADAKKKYQDILELTLPSRSASL